MKQSAYEFTTSNFMRYYFTSDGKIKIRKMVEFTPTADVSFFSIGFGDLLREGGFDDMSVSDNGDIIKVLATVVEIIQMFSEKFPGAVITFVGSTPERTKLYGRIIKTYYAKFNEKFIITALAWESKTLVEAEYDPLESRVCECYFIKRKTQ